MAGKITGTVVSISESGDLITDLSREQVATAIGLGNQVRIECDEHETFGIYAADEQFPAQTLAAILGADDCLRLTITDGDAAGFLGIKVGTPVAVTW